MTTTPITPEIPAITSEQVHRVSDAYGDAQSTLVARVRAFRPLIAAGHTVKGIHAAMVTAAAADPSITVVSTTIYGYAAAAATLAGSIDGVPFGKMSSADLALYARAAKHVGVGAFKSAARNVLNNLSDDAGADHALIMLRDAFELALSVPRADHVKTAEKVRAENERAARNMGGLGDDDAAPVAEITRSAAPLSEADALAGIRAAVTFLKNGAYSDDLASAAAELAASLTAARKRVRVTSAANVAA